MTSRTTVKSLTSFFAPAHDLELDGIVDRAAHFVDRLVESHSLGRHAVDRRDDISREDASFGRRRVVDGRHDLEQAVLLSHFDAESAEFAFRLDLHVLERFGVHVARVRIERGQHAIDRSLDHLGVIGLLDVIVAHLVEDVAKQVQLPVSVGRGGEGGGTDRLHRPAGPATVAAAPSARPRLK